MLIALSIFMVFIGISASSYIGLMRANRLASDTQRVYRDVRHVFDAIATEARNSQIDFSCFDRNAITIDPDCSGNTISDTPEVVSFISRNGDEVHRNLYRFKDGVVEVKKETLDQNNTPVFIPDWEPLMATSTKFADVSFNVFPLKNPFDRENIADLNTQWQPSIQLVVKTDENTIYRTTYSSRAYGARSLYK